MKDRLTSLIQQSVNGCARNWAEIIADYLLANGVIVPPCKVGDTAYCIFRNRETLEWYIEEKTVCEVCMDSNGFMIFVSPIISYIEMEIGVRLFFTRDAAEQALKGRVQE